MYIRSSTLTAIAVLYAEFALGDSHLGAKVRPSAAVAGASGYGTAAQAGGVPPVGAHGAEAAAAQGAAQAAGAAPVSINTGPAPNSGAAAAQATGIGISPNGGAVAVSGTSSVHVVKVGGPGAAIVFEPNKIAANPGDLVQFQFNPKNHSVSRATFDQPCVPIQQSNPSAANAFWSGFMPTERQGMLTYTIQVTDTKPMWFYCATGKHCQGGMVGVVNEPQNSPNTLQAFAAKAAAAPQNIAPNGVAGVGGGSIGTTGLVGTATIGTLGATGGVGGVGGSGSSNGVGGGVISPSGIETSSVAQQTVNAAPSLDARAAGSSLVGMVLAALMWLW